MASPLSDDELNLLGLCVVALSRKKKKITRKRWAKNCFLRREQLTNTALLSEMRVEPGDLFKYLRMDEGTYFQLLSLVTPMIEKQDTCMRRAITPHERLSATLRFLASGQSYEDLKSSVAISSSALSQIIPETCLAIWNTLKKDFMKFPDSEDEWKQIANEYHEKWNFPNCLGAVGGKHVAIVPPNGAGSDYFNYRGSHSLVLMAIVNAKYEFIMCDFGTNGHVPDGGVMENTAFYRRLCDNNLKIPPGRKPKNSMSVLPFVFVGDEAFALRKDFMSPFSQGELTHDRRVFNYRVSRAHHVVENVFGIMSSRFKIFTKPINLNLENIDVVVLACCILHNYLQRSVGDLYALIDQCDNVAGTVPSTDESTVFDLERRHNRQCSKQAEEVREMFMQYFTRDGAMSCQERMIYQD
ncbi:putative nuclease HARBI1 [Homarus americanus]|uniref:Nuclease HARBI1-like 1 n=1 Tax=Homarus americanus TaxID=6706 RepID=A0A8J5TU34_HOMAM|nr:putative nuclease HARBI1 [Homarus americanus]KAG7177258.1 nuclease HARBI1-like 1 [Homarus americanus]